MKFSNIYSTPEEVELKKKKDEFETIENDLAQYELELNTIKNELAEFQKIYTEKVIRRMYELDKVESLIARELANRKPNDMRLKEKYEKIENNINDARKIFEDEGLTKKNKAFSTSESIKNKYREAAKKIHPDLSLDEKERERRNAAMSEINNAFEEGNENKIDQILREWQSDPENIQGEDLGAQLIRTIRKIAQAENRIEKIKLEIEEISISEIFKLKEKYYQKKQMGIDLLDEMVSYLERKIIERKDYYSKLIAEE